MLLAKFKVETFQRELAKQYDGWVEAIHSRLELYSHHPPLAAAIGKLSDHDKRKRLWTTIQNQIEKDAKNQVKVRDPKVLRQALEAYFAPTETQG
jgi:hypothetical protein